MSTLLKCNKVFNTGSINYVGYGTIGWLKTKDNKVRQCRCIGARLVPPKPNYGCSTIEYEWEIAGLQEHEFGTYFKVNSGLLYLKEEYAQNGSATDENWSGLMMPNRTFLIHSFIKKYGLDNRCVQFGGPYYNLLKIQTFASFRDGTCRLVDTDFEIALDEDGLDIIVPMLDGWVDGKHRYATEEECYASKKPLEVYLFDDDADNDKKDTQQRLRVVVDIECGDLDRINDIGIIVGIVDK